MNDTEFYTSWLDCIWSGIVRPIVQTVVGIIKGIMHIVRDPLNRE